MLKQIHDQPVSPNLDFSISFIPFLPELAPTNLWGKQTWQACDFIGYCVVIDFLGRLFTVMW